MTFVGRLFFFLLVTTSAIGLGAWSAERVTRSFPGFVPISAESWRGYPGLATSSADPYARANLARTGKLAIGDTEGVEFTAITDSEGAALRAGCSYDVRGNVPTNRLWTFRIETVGQSEDASTMAVNFKSSRLHARIADVDVDLSVGPLPTGPNWLSTTDIDDQPVMFIMTLYDSAIATTASFTDLQMPTIKRLACIDG
ncbi:MAG: DUF1214 domain-containing protein [Pseudomonadota bacterium]